HQRQSLGHECLLLFNPEETYPPLPFSPTPTGKPPCLALDPPARGVLSRRAMNPSPPDLPAACGPRVRLARRVLALHLLLSPLVFCTRTAEAFEENKAALLRLAALLLAGLGVAGLLERRPRSLGDWARRL